MLNRVITRYTTATRTKIELEKIDKCNNTGAGFPADSLFVLLPPRRSATLAHARATAAKYKAGVGGPKKRKGRRQFRSVRHNSGSTT